MMEHTRGNGALSKNPGVEYSYNWSLGLYPKEILPKESWHDKAT